MRKFLLYSSALAVFGFSDTVLAACIQTPSCSSLGYTSTSSCTGGTKCPFGNAWNCTASEIKTELTEVKKTLEELQTKIIVMNCKVGDILFSDMTCGENLYPDKTAIGVVFDAAKGLAIAKDEFTDLVWSTVMEDVSGVQNSDSTTNSIADWQGFNNTKAMYEVDTSGANYPAIKKVLTYSTEGTEQGQWYLPAAGELQAISMNYDTLNETLSKIGGTQMWGGYWSSSEQNDGSSYYIGIGNNSSSTGIKVAKYKAKPVINFGSKNKTDFTYNNGGTVVTCRVGDILYSDKKCYSGGVQSGKTPIGIVFDTNRRLAIALESSPSRMQWGGRGYDIPGLTNMERAQALEDFNGKSNTSIILAYGKTQNKSYPAAEYVNNYNTEGTSAGDWYLPALGELHTVGIYSTFLNYTLSLVGKEHIASDNGYWSSSENDQFYAWGSKYSGSPIEYQKQSATHYVLPVLAF